MQARDVSARVASLERPVVQQRPSGARTLPAEFRDTEIVSSWFLPESSRMNI